MMKTIRALCEKAFQAKNEIETNQLEGVDLLNQLNEEGEFLKKIEQRLDSLFNPAEKK